MRISEPEKMALSMLNLDARCPLSKMQDQTGLSSGQLRYAIKRLRERSLIHTSCLVDVKKLGYTQYDLVLSIQKHRISMRSSLIKSLLASSLTSVVTEIGGAYDIFVSLCISHPEELDFFLNSLKRSFPDVIDKHHFALRNRMALYPYTSILEQRGHFGELVCDESRHQIRHTPLDHTLLQQCSIDCPSSNRDLAKRLSESNSTIHYRMERLANEGVLIGFHTHLSLRSLGTQSYFMLLRAHADKASFRDELRQYCREQATIRMLVETSGDWDYEITIKTKQQSELQTLTDSLLSRFSGSLGDYTLLIDYGTRKVNCLPG